MTDVVLLAHGSPDPRHADDLGALESAVRARVGGGVRLAFLDHHGPTIAEAAAALREGGPGPVVVMPILLTRAYHARVDAPTAVADLAEASGREVLLAPALGPHPLLGTAVGELLGVPAPGRILLYLAGSARDTAVTELIAVLRDSLPAGASSAVATLDERWPLAAAVDRLGGPDGVVAVGVVIAGGVLRDRMAQRCEAVGIPMVAGVLARTAALADLVLLRARESLSAPRS